MAIVDVDAVDADASLEARCRALITSIFDVFALVGPDASLRWISHGVRQCLGYEPAELEGRRVVELLHSDDLDRCIDALAGEQAIGSGSRAVSVRVRHADGEWRELEVLGTNQLATPDLGGIVLGIRDVTGRTVSGRAFAADEHLFRTLAMTATDMTTITDLEGESIYVSPSVTPMLGYDPAEFAAMPTSQFVHLDDLERWHQAVAEAEGEVGGVRRLELRCRDSRGSSRWVEATAVNLHDDPAVGGLVVHFRDIHDRRQAQEVLFHRALHDPLTGLPNRTQLLDRLSLALASPAGGLGVVVLFCDLDGFKSINDGQGHHTGDEALNVVAARIKSAVRPGDILARYGGDEFCVACSGLTDLDDARQLAERIREVLAEPLALCGARATIGISIGIAWSGGERLGPFELLHRADDAMYEAKAAGGNRVVLAAPPKSGSLSAAAAQPAER